MVIFYPNRFKINVLGGCLPAFSFVLLLFGLLDCTTIRAQKLSSKTIKSIDIHSITMDMKDVAWLELNTHLLDEVIITTTFEGEYQNDLALRSKMVGNELYLNVGYLPNFKHPNDKLSAHKVLSVKVFLTVPAYLKVKLFGTTSDVRASGDYQYLDITTSSGEVTITDFTSTLLVTTYSGNINLKKAKGHLTYQNKYGTVTGQPKPNGHNVYKLVTVTGHIEINPMD